jgi:hypothetical protein
MYIEEIYKMASTSLIPVSEYKKITINIDNNESFIITEEQYNDIKNVIKNNFNDEEAIMFIENFFMYMKYGSDCQEFVVDFNDVWKWCDFTRKDPAKRFLIKNFKENEDYIIKDNIQSCEKLIHQSVESTQVSNKFDKTEYIYLKIDVFEQFCMLAGTEKAKRIRKFYIKMKNIFFKLIINKELFKNKEDIKSYTNNIDFEKSQVYFINIGKKTNKGGFICRDKNNKVIEGNKTIIKYGRQGLKTGRQPVHIKTFENYNLIDSLFTNKPIELETYTTRLSKMKGLWCKIEDPKEYKGDEYLAIDSQNTYNNFIIDINEKCLEINNKFLIEDKSKEDTNIELKKLEIELKKEETKQIVGVEELKLKEKQEETKQEELKLKEEQEKTKQKELDFKILCLQMNQTQLINNIYNKNQEEPIIENIPIIIKEELPKETEKVIKSIKTEKTNNNQNTVIVQQKKKRNSKKSNYIGVTFMEPSELSNRKTTTYSSRIYYNKKYYYLGTYDTIEEAGYAYNCKAFELYGFEYENFNDVDLSKTHEFDHTINRLILIQ